MAKVRLGYGHVALGQPLPFDLFDEHETVLLKQGYVIPSESQLDRLIERGVFFEEVADRASQQQQAAEAEKVSVYSRVAELAQSFEGLIGGEAPDYRGALWIARQIQELCGLDSDAALANIQLEKTTRYSLRHSFHTAVLTEILLRRLEREPETRCHAVAGALTMNVCMLELQDSFYRQNAPLTIEQKRSIVAHPQLATRVLRDQGIDHPVWLDVVEHHHEMIDGSGYAKRLGRDALSIESQGVSLADRFCALVSEREYRPGLLPGMAAKDLLGRQAATIDPVLADAFLKEVGCYPPGTVVALVNGEVGVVVKRLLNPAQPLVRSLRSANGIRYPEPPKRVTSKAAYAIKEELNSDIAKDFEVAVLWQSVEADGGNLE